jgi:hypothetical protein
MQVNDTTVEPQFAQALRPPGFVALLAAVTIDGQVAVQLANERERDEASCQEIADVCRCGLDRIRRDLARHVARQSRKGSAA